MEVRPIRTSCVHSFRFPPGISIFSIRFADCLELATLPEDLQTHCLEVQGCPNSKIPDSFWSRPGLAIQVE